jgi:hypothetical protein
MEPKLDFYNNELAIQLQGSTFVLKPGLSTELVTATLSEFHAGGR